MAKRSKRRAKGAAKRKAKRRVARVQAPRSTGSAEVVKQIAAYRAELVEQRNELQSKIDQATAALDAMGSTPTPPRPAARTTDRRANAGGRRKRKGSLKVYILDVLDKGGQMAVKDIAAAVRRAGYKTNSANFGNQVSNALAQMDEVTKLERGRYQR